MTFRMIVPAVILSAIAATAPAWADGTRPVAIGARIVHGRTALPTRGVGARPVEGRTALPTRGISARRATVLAMAPVGIRRRQAVVTPVRSASVDELLVASPAASLPAEAAYLQALAAAARGGNWQQFRDRLVALDVDPSVLSTEAPGPIAAVQPIPGRPGGAIDPQGSPQAIAARAARMSYYGFDRPVVLVGRLRGHWQKVYDDALAQMATQYAPPILALCPSQMTLAIGGFVHPATPGPREAKDDYLLEAHARTREMLQAVGFSLVHISGR